MRVVQFLNDVFWMLAAVAFVGKALERFLVFRKELWRRLVVYFSAWIVIGNILYIGDKVNLPLGLAVFILGMYLGCEGRGIRKVTVSVMVSSMIMAYNALADNWAERLFADILLYVADRVGFAVLFYLAVRHFGPEKDYELSASMWRLLLLLSLTPLAIVMAVVMIPDMYWRDLSDFWLHFVLLCIAFFTFVGLLWTISVLAKQQKMEQELLFAKVNQAHYDAMEQQQFEVRRLKHDLANHLQTLAALSDEQRTDYIQELLANNDVTKVLNYCGDSTINAVLTVKESMMQKQGIDFHRKLGIPGELNIEKADLCAVFANALDNAIEACMRQGGSEKKIRLECCVKKGMFVLSVKNPLEKELETMSGSGNEKRFLPNTEKKDKKNHGFGLRSIQEVAHRHGGELELKAENGEFELFVYFPIKDV